MRTLLTSLFLVGALAALPAIAQENRAEAQRVVLAWADLVEDLRDAILPERLDPFEAVSALGFDGEAIAKHVTGEIAFQSYPGTLRGVEGTLRSGAGNALDQSLLLGKLLRDAGLDVRIARATLNADQAEALLRTMRPLSADDAPLYDEVRLIPVLTAMRDLMAGRVDGEVEVTRTSATDMAALVRQLEETLTTALSEASVTLDLAPVPAAMIEEARDYYWVEHRLAPFDPWEATHPAADPALPFLDELKAQGHIAGAVPEEMVQKVSLRTVARVRVGDKTKDHALFKWWTRPAANLARTPVAYSHAFDFAALDADGLFDEEGPLFLPKLNGLTPSGAKAFDRGGFVLDADEAQSTMAGVFRTVGKAGSKATGALAALSANGPAEDGEAPRPAMELAALWLEIAVTVPGREQVIHHRSYAPDGGPPTDAQIARDIVLEVVTGPPGRASLLDAALATYADDLRRAIAASDDAIPMPPVRLRSFDVVMRTLTAVPRGTGTVAYRPAPLIFARHAPLSAAGERGIDIVHAPVRVFAGTGAAMMIDPGGALRQGLREGVGETIAARTLQDGDDAEAVTSAATVFAGTGARVSGAIPDATQGKPALTPAERLATATVEGAVLVLPEGAEPEGAPAWWRVDPVTGETMGMLANGWGGVRWFDELFGIRPASAQAMTEDLINRQVARALQCAVVVSTGCVSLSKFGGGAIKLAALEGVDTAVGTMLATMGIPGEMPPGMPGVKDIVAYQIWVDKLVARVEQALYRNCFKQGIKRCTLPR